MIHASAQGMPRATIGHATDSRHQATRSLPELLHDPSDLDLLRTVLGGHAPVDLALGVLGCVGSLGHLESCAPERLLAIRGLGVARLERLRAAIELGRRCLMERRDTWLLESHHDVYEWALPRLVHLEHEELWLLSLDGKNSLKSAERVAQGGLLGCAVTPRDVLRPAVRNAAVAVVVVHNHPSGDPSPSEEDLRMTEHLARACEILGIPLLDHVVVARGGSRSIAETGLLQAA
jgi:DNA repair protein RadC